MSCERCGQVHDPARCRAHVRLDGGGLRPCGRYPMKAQRTCAVHGGRSPQARAKAAMRLALDEALQRAPRRPVGEVILDTSHAADVMFRQARDALIEEGATVESIERLTTALERAHRLAKTSHEAGLEERQVRLEEEKGDLLVAGLQVLFVALGLHGRELARANALTGHMLRALAEGRVPQLKLVRSDEGEVEPS